MSRPELSTRTVSDVRMYVTLLGVLLLAAGLAARIARPRADWHPPEGAHRFLGLDEPVVAMPPRR